MADPEVGNPEQHARRTIDAALVAAGWAVQDRKDMNLAAAAGVAVREFQTGAGPADYLLFLGNLLVGVVEAKRAGVALSGVEAQTRDYAAKAPKPLQVPVRPLPFLYESTGVETWFTNGLDATDASGATGPARGGCSPSTVPRPCGSGSTPSWTAATASWARPRPRR
jgi:type I site-specific restriction endonuclease